jgi:hypothetical protein
MTGIRNVSKPRFKVICPWRGKRKKLQPSRTSRPPPVPIGKDLAESLLIYKTFREYIRHEDALINNRMTWVFTIHGFLYATYGFTIQKKLEVDNNIVSTLVQTFGPQEVDVASYWRLGSVGWSILETDFFCCRSPCWVSSLAHMEKNQLRPQTKQQRH